MKRKFAIIISLALVSVIGLTSCAKKEEPVPPAPPPPSSQMMQDQGHADIQMPKADEMKIIVADNIKTKWKGVKLTVTDKESNVAKEYTIALHSRFSIPNSKIEVQTGDFLPDLKIDGNVYATATNDLLNPAVQVYVTDNGKEVFKGWLFQKFPNIHPFKHQKFGITLKEPLVSI